MRTKVSTEHEKCTRSLKTKQKMSSLRDEAIESVTLDYGETTWDAELSTLDSSENRILGFMVPGPYPSKHQYTINAGEGKPGIQQCSVSSEDDSQDFHVSETVECLPSSEVQSPGKDPELALMRTTNGLPTDWGFLQKRPILEPYSAFSDCPSLTSGSAMSSRNSSTRSARSFKWKSLEDDGEKKPCPLPQCGRFFRDPHAHMLTHQPERPEKCPMLACQYSVKGFARAYDRDRHALNHFGGSLMCGFCHDSTDPTEKTFDSVQNFSRHLIRSHGPDAKNCEDSGQSENTIATCTLCSEPFNAQGFSEHLAGCVLRRLSRSSECLSIAASSKTQTKEPRNTFVEDRSIMLSNRVAQTSNSLTHDEMTKVPIDLVDHGEVKQSSVKSDNAGKDIEELTASSRCLSLTSSKAVESSDEETDWTEDPGSRESTPDTPHLQRRLSPIKNQLVENIMKEFHRLFDQSKRSHNGDGGSGTPQGSYAGSSSASTYSTSSFISRKRSLSRGSPPPNDGDDPNKRRRPDPRQNGKHHAPPELRFACPYYKRNPGRHQTFTSCRDPGFVTVARLKEHLYRRHLLPPQCNRCCATFTDDLALREHQRDSYVCEIQEQIPLEGFDKDQERRLKSKKRSLVYQSEEDKWKSVYRILFPDDSDADMPFPYIEYQPCSGYPQTEASSSVSQYQNFSRLELPRLVRRNLEIAVQQEAQPLEERLKDRLVDIVRECQMQLITMFQSTLPNETPLASIIESDPPAIQIPHTNPVPEFNAYPEVPFTSFDSAPPSSYATSNSAQASTFVPAHQHDGVPKQQSPPLAQGLSGSPDSGYSSTWTIPNISHDALVVPSLPMRHDHGLVEGTNVDLEGYYGLFENRITGANLDASTAANGGSEGQYQWW